LYSTYSINKAADCGYQVQGTERKISHLLYMDDLERLGKSEHDLDNEVKIVKEINKAINRNFGLEKCARICFKKAGFKAKHN